MCLEVSLPFFSVAVRFPALSSGNIQRRLGLLITLHMVCAMKTMDGFVSRVFYKKYMLAYSAIHFSCRQLALGVQIAREMPGGRREVHSTTYLRLLQGGPQSVLHIGQDFYRDALFAYKSHPGITYTCLYIDSASGSGFKFRPSTVT